MADEAQLVSLRRLTALEEDDVTYTDSVLGGMIDQLGFETAAATIWREKAAAAAGLVDITESGSSRRLSGLAGAYLNMARAVMPEATGTEGQSFTVEIERV